MAKITSNEARSTGVKSIPPALYSDLTSVEFGSQEIKGLELLSMSLPKADDGYYHCFLQSMFNQYFD